MYYRRNNLSLLSLLALALLCFTAPAFAQTGYKVQINTSGFNGVSGQLAFDLLAGDATSPNNTIGISHFSTDGTLAGGGNANLGGASGDLPGNLSFTDSLFFNESLRGITFGNALFFQLTSTENFAAPGSPDEFSFYLLDSTGTTSLVETSDPTGANALFTLDITGASGGGVTVYDPVNSDLSYSVAAGLVPETSSLSLLLGGGFCSLLFTFRRLQRR